MKMKGPLYTVKIPRRSNNLLQISGCCANFKGDGQPPRAVGNPKFGDRRALNLVAWNAYLIHTTVNRDR